MLRESAQGSLLALLFHLAFWQIDLEYFGRGLLVVALPQLDIGIVVVAVGRCRRLGNKRTVGAIVHHPKAGNADGLVGSISVRLGSPNSPTTAVVRGAGIPPRSAPREPI